MGWSIDYGKERHIRSINQIAIVVGNELLTKCNCSMSLQELK